MTYGPQVPEDDRPPVPVEPQAVDRPWRLWASVAIGSFVLLAIVIGFFVISFRGEDGVAGALGIVHRHEATLDAFAAATPPPTEVAWTTATRTLLRDASLAEGQAIATGTCAGCHGENGIATAAAFPNLAGLSAAAIYKQLRDYADGHRPSPIMAGIAQGIDEGQMAEVARYYASLPAPARSARTDIQREIVVLATNGDPARGLPPCDSCHTVAGGPVGTPGLDGQAATYLEQQLAAFAAGERGNDIYGLMRSVAVLLTPTEIEQLARYYGE
ncbi:MAG: cytochrome c [Bauldia sp.]